MGLSSSQARLLTLTGRMHDIEYKAARLEAQKLQMANESARVYETYLNALDATKIQYQTIGTDGSLDYVDATYASMIDNGYILKIQEPVRVTRATADNFTTAAGNKDYFVYLQTGESGAPEGYIPIYTAEQLMNIDLDGNYILMADIDLGGAEWTPIGSYSNPFTGTFDGNGHTISNYTISTENNGSGLFGCTDGATITNVIIENAIISSTGEDAGALIGCAYDTTVSNCVVSSSVSGQSYVGGAIGCAIGCTITNCSSSSNVSASGSYNSSTNTITSDGFAGGFAGYVSNCTIDNCSSSGTVSALTYAGGLAGCVSNCEITNSDSSSNVSVSSARAGGLIGGAYQSVVSSCYATGDVSGPTQIGGFIGSNGETSTISNCYATGNAIGVTTEFQSVYDANNLQDSIGGFVGGNWGTITNCYATGDASGENNIGGFVGFNADTSTAVISNSWASGSVSTDATDAGLFSGDTKPASSIENCYVVSSTSGEQIYLYTDGNIRSDYVTTATSSEINSMSDAGTTTTSSIGSSCSTPSVTYKNTSDEALEAEALFDEITSLGYIVTDDTSQSSVNGHENDVEWLAEMINAGYIYIYKEDSESGELYQVSVATDTNLREVSDESGLKKAEAKYEADMKRIDRKDSKYDTDLASIENEREAIKQEIETLKTVAKDNVERTFKLFS
ncbi:MAG: hypothetical protein LUB59_06775 [Candidatus Gastranaerophilales bacterium]|nr:hypothetical protein [Candidatus Gastranaerophilales bacterium]